MKKTRTEGLRNSVPTRAKAASAGFTLVELMVVIAIIAGLALIVGVNVLGAMDDADVTNAQAQIKNFKTALVSYKISFKKFPTTEEGLEELISNGKNKNFMDAREIPVDPWGNPYIYSSQGGRSYVITTYGADGVPGGSEYDADISSDNLGGNEN